MVVGKVSISEFCFPVYYYPYHIYRLIYKHIYSKGDIYYIYLYVYTVLYQKYIKY